MTINILNLKNYPGNLTGLWICTIGEAQTVLALLVKIITKQKIWVNFESGNHSIIQDTIQQIDRSLRTGLEIFVPSKQKDK